ncbi:MAG: diguanylate cyclase [Alphaproteobacteria bacterium]|nr:diguanylate cyclase [Alphaproteobacteria bacterium]
MGEVGTAFPLALAGQALAAVIIFALAYGADPQRLPPAIVGAGGANLVVGAIALLLLKARPFRGLPPYIQLRAALAYGAALGAGHFYLVQEAAHFPQGMLRDAAVLAAGASTALCALALLPARVGLLAFFSTVGALTIAIAGFSLATSIASLFLLCFGGATLSLARRDLLEAAHTLRREGEALRSRRLVHEFETAGTGWFWETDRYGRLTYLSEKVALDLSAGGDILGKPLTQIFEMDSDATQTERALSFHLSGRTSFSEYSVRRANGASDRWWSISGRPLFDDFGQFCGFIGSGSDLTAKRRSEAEIARLAMFDGLTGLANRQRMRHSFDQLLSQQTSGYRPTALFLLDLDRFKAVNDTLGHQTGDELLKQVAHRLQASVGEAGLVGRLGGDEFEVVLPSESDRERLARLADSIIAAISQPYAVNGATIMIGCSIGIAVSPVDGDTSEVLIRNADLALYAAKANGRGVHRFYREELLAEAHSRKLLEDDLRSALVKGEFQLAYQPVVATQTAEIVGYEALLRWNHPTRGLVSPADFIPVAEDCGLIEEIGEWVLRTACTEAALWPGGVRVGVNVSPIQFANPGLPALLVNAIANAGIEPGRLELEITEGVFLHESAATDRMFAQLKSIGVRLALDDFGTGYSSLGYLKTAPFDKIKIDQSFVRGAAVADNRNAAIIKAIVTLADTLGMETTAEGVEVQDEIDLIRELGCSHIQGYVYGRPVVATEVREQLSAAGFTATPLGHRFSRAPRTRMLRSTLFDAGGRRTLVRLRNVSTSGAMIDEVGQLELGGQVLIELIEGKMFHATVRWISAGKAGLEFAQPFHMNRADAAPAPRLARRTA